MTLIILSYLSESWMKITLSNLWFHYRNIVYINSRLLNKSDWTRPGCFLLHAEDILEYMVAIFLSKKTISALYDDTFLFQITIFVATALSGISWLIATLFIVHWSPPVLFYRDVSNLIKIIKALHKKAMSVPK